MTYANANFLVELDWLLERKDEPNLVIVDCPGEYYSFTRAHIPGAVCRPEHSYVKGKDAEDNISLHLPNLTIITSTFPQKNQRSVARPV